MFLAIVDKIAINNLVQLLCEHKFPAHLFYSFLKISLFVFILLSFA
jgi:hypothetical protein